MKNPIKIFVLLFLFSFISNAQTAYQTKQATSFSEHASTQLDLSEEDQKFIYDTYIAKFMNNRANIFGKNLSNEERFYMTMLEITGPNQFYNYSVGTVSVHRHAA